MVILDINPDSKMVKISDSDLVIARKDALFLMRGKISGRGKLYIKMIQKSGPYFWRKNKEMKIEILNLEVSLNSQFLILHF